MSSKEMSSAASGQTRSTKRGRHAAACEFALLIGGVLAIMWVVPFLPHQRTVSRAIIGCLLLLLAFTQWRDREALRSLGFRWDNFFPVLRRLMPFVAGLIFVLIALGAALGTLRFGARFWSMLVSVPVWGLLQQYLLLGFAHRRLRVVLGAGRESVWATAAVFGLVHLPNPALTIVCALGGWVWAREYDRSPNLFAHAVTHALGSAVLANSLPHAFLKNMVVGYRYLVI